MKDIVRDSSVDAEALLRSKQVELLYDQSRVALSATAAAGLIMVGVFWPASSRPVLLGWVGCFVLTTAARLVLIRSYQRSQRLPQDANAWLAWFVAGVTASGTIWGLTAILPPADSLLHIGFTVLWACGLSAGAVAALSVVKGAFFMFAVPATVPSALYLLMQADGVIATIGGAQLLFMTFISLSAVRMHRTLVKGLLLQVQNVGLVAHLNKEKARVDRLNEQLEARVAERTLELEQARDTAQEANRAKSTFLANMSHEIRTPMSAVMGMAQLALDTTAAARQRDYLTKILASSDALLTIIDDILDFSRIEAGKLRMESVAFDLGEVLGRVSDAIELPATDKRLELQVWTAPDVPPVLVGDPVRLGQILLNLASNAVKFTAHGEIAVEVRVVSAWEGGVELGFSVRDTGIGIPIEQQHGLFEAFTQADDSTTRRYGGTGLGLAICSQLVEMMQGTMHIDSRPGLGTTVSFTARLAVATERAGQPGHHSNARARVPIPALRGTKVLIVDDQPLNRQIAAEILSRAGADVDEAENGRDAVRRVLAEPGVRRYDAVFMDIQMPDMDGYEATTIIREQWTAEQLPIIAMTAHAMVETRDHCLRAGMNEHLTKPLKLTRVLEALRHWVQRPSSMPIHDTPTAIDAGQRELRDTGDRLEETGGIDIETGIVRVGGSRARYRQLLARFRVVAAEHGEHLRDAIARGDHDRARTAAHALKGLAGNLSVTAVESAAAALESALESPGVTPISKLAEYVESALTEVLSALEASGPREDGGARDGLAQSRRSPQSGDFEIKLQELAALLKARDMDAGSRFRAIAAEYDLSDCGDEAVRFEHALGELRYELALSALRDMSTALDHKAHVAPAGGFRSTGIPIGDS